MMPAHAWKEVGKMTVKGYLKDIMRGGVGPGGIFRLWEACENALEREGRVAPEVPLLITALYLSAACGMSPLDIRGDTRIRYGPDHGKRVMVLFEDGADGTAVCPLRWKFSCFKRIRNGLAAKGKPQRKRLRDLWSLVTQAQDDYTAYYKLACWQCSPGDASSAPHDCESADARWSGGDGVG